MIPSLSIGPCTLINNCNHSASAIFWRLAIPQTLRWKAPQNLLQESSDRVSLVNASIRIFAEPSSDAIYSFFVHGVESKSEPKIIRLKN